jgi:LPS O-antigen subunit length determinant protein (WzzB/FepE family)
MEDKDTIELIDLLRVLWKWKWFIIIFTLACSIIAGIISFSMPKVYAVSMVIEPGVFDIDPDGKFIFLDSPSNIKSKIDAQAYNRKICKKLNADPKRLNLRFKTIQPSDSNTLKISLETQDTNKYIQALSALFYELVEEYQHYVDSRKSLLDQEIAMIGARLREKNLLEKQINIMMANNNRIVQERSELINRSDKNLGNLPNLDKLSLLIYSNIIQQNMAHYNDLNKQLGELMLGIEEMEAKMNSLKIKKQSIENIKLVQRPQSSVFPIKPKKTLNVVLAFVVGLFLSIFLAFFLEYLQKMGVYSKSSSSLG